MVHFGDKDHLEIALIKAILFHVILFILFYGVSQFLGFDDLKPVSIKDVEVIKSAVRIDIVAMPKLTVKELKKVNLSTTEKEPVEVKEEPKLNETSKVEFKKKAKKIDVNNLLKNFSQKKVIKKKVKTKKDKPKVDPTELRKIILEGNKVSQGSSTTGESVDDESQAFISYVQSLPDQVKPHWKLPSYLMDKGLRCRVRIFLDKNGKILKSLILESSGEQEYDAKALDAVKNSSPFTPPKKGFLGRAIGGDIVLGFPL